MCYEKCKRDTNNRRQIWSTGQEGWWIGKEGTGTTDNDEGARDEIGVTVVFAWRTHRALFLVKLAWNPRNSRTAVY